jgi:hypothetical protein
MRRFTWWLLRTAEEIFLVAHGWKKLENDNWDRPAGYEHGQAEPYRTGHAVNSQKWTCRYEQQLEEQRRWKESQQ